MAQASRMVCAVAVGWLFLLSACGQEAPAPATEVSDAPEVTSLPSPTPSQTPTPFPSFTPSPPPTEPPPPSVTPIPSPTSTPTPAPTAVGPIVADFVYAEVALSLPGGLDFPPPEGMTLLPTELFPEHIQLSFSDQLPPDGVFEPREARILIFDLAAYTADNPERAAAVDQLISLLSTPQLESDSLPFLPLLELNQSIVAQAITLPFRNGAGLRYLTQFDQIPGPVHNQSLFYTFQGVTDDRSQLVTAYFPISASLLPDSFEDSDLTAFGTDESRARYYLQTTQLLNELAPGDFQPSLGQLDQLIASLQVGLDGREVILVTPEPESVDLPNGLGRIAGTISYPEGDGPVFRVYAQSLEANGRYFFVNTTEDEFRLDVPPGEYQVFAYTTDGVQPGGYTLRSLCAPDEGCTDQTPAPVTVTLGNVTSGIEIADWNITDPTFPVPPDGLSGSSAQPETVGTISGDIEYPDSTIPSLTIYVQELTTDAVFTLETNQNQSFYTIDVPSGVYVVYAWLADGSAAGGYTEGGADLAPIVVQEGQTTGEITIGDFNSPPLNYIPAPPEAASEPLALAQPRTGLMRGKITGPTTGPAPAMVIFFREINTNQLDDLRLSAGFETYFIEMTAGIYEISARLLDGSAVGGYTLASLCSPPASCVDHGLQQVELLPGATLDGIDINDWSVDPALVPNP